MKKEENKIQKLLRKIGIISNKNLKLIIKVLCVLAAVSIWFYFDSLENPKITANIENIVVELRNEDSLVFPDYNYEIFTGRNQRINIAVKGTEANIEKVKNDIVAYVDLKEARFDENTMSRLMNIYIDKKSIPAGIEIVSQSQSVMIVAIDKVIEKTFEDVNVTPDLGGQMLPDGYSLGDEIVVKYNGEIIKNFTVRGPEQIIEKIKTVEVVVDCKDRIRSFTASGSILLMDEYNNPLAEEDTKYVEITPKSVLVEVPILREQNIQLFVRGNKTGENIYKYTNVQIYPSEVTVYGDTLVMDKDDLVLPIEIDESLIIQRNGLYNTKSILETAGGITIRDDYQVTVDVQVNFQKVKDANYWVSSDSFQPINIHEDVQYFQVIDDGINIRIRGAESIVDQLTDIRADETHGGDVIAYIDMSGFDGNTTGVQKVPLLFEFDISNLQDDELTEEEQQIYVFEIGPEPYYVNIDFGYDTYNTVDESDLNEDSDN